MARYSTILRDQNEVPISGAVVSVINPATGGLATLTDDLGASILNPITTGALGDVTFNAADNVYRLEYRINGIERRIDDVIVGSPSAFAGPAGPAFATYFTLATFKAAATSNATQILQDPAIAFGQFNWETANAPYTADNINVIKANSTALSVGAWVRQKALGLNFDGRSVDAKLRDVVSVFDARFAGGAVGNGTTDDTAAFLAALAALPSGGTLNLGNGNTFKLSQSLILTKPVRIVGGAMEQNILLFASTGTYQALSDGTKAAVVALHNTTVLSSYSGDARRSTFSGVTFKLQSGGPANTRGVVLAAPCYFHECRSEGWTSTGFAVMATNASDAPLIGNANGTSFSNCASQSNGSHGYQFVGNNSNACHIQRSFAANCGGYGFRDESFLGNIFVACEADTNTTGGYYSSSTSTNHATFIGCYSETSPHFVLGPYGVNINPQGVYRPNRAAGGVGFSGLPNGLGYFTQPIVIASTDDIANSNGDTPNAGAVMHIGDDGLDYRASATSLHVKINGVLSANYTDLLNGSNVVFRMANSAVAGNVSPSTPWLPGGFVTGANVRSGILGAGAAAPTTGTYAVGAIWLNESPAAAGKVGWVCVTAGAPGEWKPFGAIDA